MDIDQQALDHIADLQDEIDDLTEQLDAAREEIERLEHLRAAEIRRITEERDALRVALDLYRRSPESLPA